MESEPSSAGILCGWSFSKSTRVYTQPHPSWRLSLLRRAQWPHGPTAQPKPQAAPCSKARLARVSGPPRRGGSGPTRPRPAAWTCSVRPVAPQPLLPLRLPRPFGPHVLTHSMALPAGTRTSTCCPCTRAAHAPSDFPPCRPAPAQLLAPTSDTSAPLPQTCRQLRGDAPCLHDPNPAPLQDPGAWPLGKGLIVCLCF